MIKTCHGEQGQYSLPEQLGCRYLTDFQASQNDEPQPFFDYFSNGHQGNGSLSIK
jgi:hypothetical protein